MTAGQGGDQGTLPGTPVLKTVNCLPPVKQALRWHGLFAPVPDQAPGTNKTLPS